MGSVLSCVRHLAPFKLWGVGREGLPGTDREETLSGRARRLCWLLHFGSWSGVSVCAASSTSHVLFRVCAALKRRHKHACQWAFKKREAWRFWWACLRSLLDQESAPVLTSKAGKVNQQKRMNSYLLPRAFCVFFFAIFKGLKNSNWDESCSFCRQGVPVGAGLWVWVPVGGLVRWRWATCFSVQKEKSSGQDSLCKLHPLCVSWCPW